MRRLSLSPKKSALSSMTFRSTLSWQFHEMSPVVLRTELPTRNSEGPKLLDMPASEPPASELSKDYRDRYEQLTGSSLLECPVCHQGRMLVIEILAPSPHRQVTPIKDTS